MRYLIRHQTRLAFPAAVREHHCELRVAPIDDELQRRGSLRIAVEPAAHLRSYADAFGNLVHYFDVLAPHAELLMLVEADVETRLDDPLDYPAVPAARERAWIVEALRAHPPLWDFVLHRSPLTPAVAGLGVPGVPTWAAGVPVLDQVRAAMAWIATRLAPVPGASDVDAPLASAVARREGDCRDFAHLLVAVVRSWGVPARYVVGYLAPGHAADDALDAQARHGWTEVLVPGAGWRGFDAVHGLVANDTFVRVAVGRDHRDAAPQRGTFHGVQGGEGPEVRLAAMRQHHQQ